jgi:hypothetical protein
LLKVFCAEMTYAGYREWYKKGAHKFALHHKKKVFSRVWSYIPHHVTLAGKFTKTSFIQVHLSVPVIIGSRLSILLFELLTYIHGLPQRSSLATKGPRYRFWWKIGVLLSEPQDIIGNLSKCRIPKWHTHFGGIFVAIYALKLGVLVWDRIFSNSEIFAFFICLRPNNEAEYTRTFCLDVEKREWSN